MKRFAPSALLALLSLLLVAPVAFSASAGPGGRFYQRLHQLEEQLQGPSAPRPKPRPHAAPPRPPQTRHPEPVRAVVTRRVEPARVPVRRRAEPSRPRLTRRPERPARTRTVAAVAPARQTPPRAASPEARVFVPVVAQKINGFYPAAISYTVYPRSARATSPKGTGDVILLAEPEQARVFFYVRGGSQLPGLTNAYMKACQPQKLHVVVYAPELQGRTQAFVPVQANHITTVRFVFPDPQKKFAGKSKAKNRLQPGAARAARAPVAAPKPAGGPAPAAIAPHTGAISETPTTAPTPSLSTTP
jgi:hypothetical protein